MASGCSWDCVYFVRGRCAYKSDKHVCALDVRGIDKTEDYELLGRLQDALLLYVRKAMKQSADRLRANKTRTATRHNVKRPLAGKYAFKYLELLREVMDKLRPESICNYALACSDPLITPGFFATSAEVMELLRKGECNTRKVDAYLWHGLVGISDKEKAFGIKKQRDSLPPLNPDQLSYHGLLTKLSITPAKQKKK